jgi:hypothetical protein
VSYHSPFLLHNSIVIDRAARTMIDKEQHFNLMNPSVHPLLPAPKKKLRDIFNEIKEDCALMVAKLKMVCAECKNLMRNKFEPIRPFDVVTAVQI